MAALDGGIAAAEVHQQNPDIAPFVSARRQAPAVARLQRPWSEPALDRSSTSTPCADKVPRARSECVLFPRAWRVALRRRRGPGSVRRADGAWSAGSSTARAPASMIATKANRPLSRPPVSVSAARRVTRARAIRTTRRVAVRRTVRGLEGRKHGFLIAAGPRFDRISLRCAVNVRLQILAVVVANPVRCYCAVSPSPGPVSYSKLETVKARSRRFVWANPHPMISLDVRRDDLTIEKWSVGGPATNRMAASGWSRDNLAGRRVTGIGYQFNDGQKIIRLGKGSCPTAKNCPSTVARCFDVATTATPTSVTMHRGS